VFTVGAPVDQQRALSLSRLDGNGMQRYSGSVVAELPFKCTSYPRLTLRPIYPRLGERQLSGSTGLDELSMSPRLSSNANLSQDLDATDLLPDDLLPVAGSMTEGKLSLLPVGVIYFLSQDW